jgi:hypothetical protein
MTTMMDPMTVPTLRSLLLDAARGRFPDADGGWTRIQPWRPDLEGVVAFTGHAFLAIGADVDDALLADLGVDGYGGAHAPRVVQTLAGPTGWVGTLDVVLVSGVGDTKRVRTVLVDRPDLADRPAVERARRVRDDVRTLGTTDPEDHSLVTVARGLGGLVELGIETDGHAHAASMIRAARALAPAGDPVVATVPPANARALRAFLRAGFKPVASVQLYKRDDSLPGAKRARARG